MSQDIISDYSRNNLKEIPPAILDMNNLRMLFLERNFLTELPNNFFHLLPNLMWLDLRNNQLKQIPVSVAYHQFLEHLLLTNNCIEELPNELGLVNNLKALQIADNPLFYPPPKIVEGGIKAIKAFLKQQYEIGIMKMTHDKTDFKKEFNNQSLDKEELTQMQEKEIIKIHEEKSKFSLNKSASNSNKSPLSPEGDTKPKITTNTRTKSISKLSRKLSDRKNLCSSLSVKKLRSPNWKPHIEPLEIMHDVDKSNSKIELKSYFAESEMKSNSLHMPEKSLKEAWLNKLKILLNEQERILQQERNLKTLRSWRQAKLKTSNKTNDANSEPPFAIYPEYSKMLSREELASQLHSFLQKSEILSNRFIQPKYNLNLDKIINDLVSQLKEMEITHNDVKSPEEQIDELNKQIQNIVSIHKKLLKLKSANNSH